MGRGPTTKYHIPLADGYVKGSLTFLDSASVKSCAMPDFPYILNIEPTNYCNLHCYCCAGQVKAKRNKGYMNIFLYKRIIDGCRQTQLRMLNLHKDGEPLLHPLIIPMIKYAKQADCFDTIHMNTNGIALNNINTEDLIMSGLHDLTISIDAFTPVTYQKIKGADLLNLVKTNTISLIEEKRNLGLELPLIRVKIMEFEDTKDEIEPFCDFWRDKADQVQVTGVHDWSGSIPKLTVTDEVHRQEGRWPCNLLWTMLAVNWDGTVSCCNLDWDLSGKVGNLCFDKNDTIQSIWQGKKMRKLRREHLCGKYQGVCEGCIIWAAGDNLKEWFNMQKDYL